MTETPLPTLITNPAGDSAFRAAAEAALDTVQSIAEFEKLLRGTYPRAIARARSLSGEPRVVWYVYRDGHWVRGDAAEE
jgi:hypothetical protein